jgi:tRNA A37 threonylcarbamoyladenosine dehydratase
MCLRPPPEADPAYDRQARLFGDRGQALLATLKVGVIGAGGAGLLLLQWLAHLGVGHLVAVDPDRLETSNLPRGGRFHARGRPPVADRRGPPGLGAPARESAGHF